MVLGVWLLLTGAAEASTIDRIAAVVNDEVVALSEVYDLGGNYIDGKCVDTEDGGACRREKELEVLDSLILDSLMRQELDRLGMTVTGDDVDRAIGSMMMQNGYSDREAFKAEIERQFGMDWASYKDGLKQQLQQMRFNESIIRPRISVTDDEVKDAYLRMTREWQGEPILTLDAFAMAVPEELDEEAYVAFLEDARTIAAELNDGTREWDASCTELDAGSFVDKGCRGWMQVGTSKLHEAFAVVADTEPGTVAEPVVLGPQVYFVRVAEVVTTDAPAFEQAEETLLSELYEGKMEDAITQWYQQARRKNSVRVLLEEP